MSVKQEEFFSHMFVQKNGPEKYKCLQANICNDESAQKYLPKCADIFLQWMKGGYSDGKVQKFLLYLPK
jgi:hypothetical protein